MTPRLPPRIALTALLLVLSPAVSGCGLGESRDEHGRTPLMVAADAGNLEEARRLLRTGANVNARVDSNDLQAFIAVISWMQDVPSRNVGWTPLHFAVQGGHSELAFLLLEHGANVGTVSRNGLTPLLIAVFRGRKDLVQQLLEAGARPAGPRDLLAAIQRRDPEIVRLLLDSGAAVNGRDDKGWTPITAGAVARDAEIVRLLLAAGANPHLREPVSNWTPFQRATHTGDEEILAALTREGQATNGVSDLNLVEASASGDAAALQAALQSGARPDARDQRGRTALLLAARAGHEELVGRLLHAGATVDAPSPYDGTPLLAASENGHSPVVRRLVAAGANLEQRDGVRGTPLLSAIRFGHTELALELLRLGARPEGQALANAALRGDARLVDALLGAGLDIDTHSGTALRNAARGDHPELARALLRRGADPRLADSTGMTALHYAACDDDPALLEMLLEAGADLEAQNLSESTPLHFAASCGKLESAKRLIARGANVRHRNSDGRSLVFAARGHPEVQDYLIRQGAPGQ